MEISVSGNLDDLVGDLKSVAKATAVAGPKIVKKNVMHGEQVMERIARSKSGRHGKSYYKRITSEMHGPLSGEFGPHDGGLPVGAGWRHGVNTDAPEAADIQGPKFAADVAKFADRVFWSGAR